jgi:hypothetical protein
MQDPSPPPARQGHERPRLRAGCPITKQDIQEVQRIRQALVRLGYRPIAVHSPWSLTAELSNAGKQPLTEVVNGQKQRWTDGHSLHRLNYVTPVSTNTGLVLGGDAALVALDIDPRKDASDEEQQALTYDVLRTLRLDQLWSKLELALVRLRSPASIVVLMRAEKTMNKIKVAGERGAVELLGGGQHVVVDGYHPKSLDGQLVRWAWRGGRSPWTVPVSDLPIVPAMEIEGLMQRIGVSGILGAERLQPPPSIETSGQVRAAAYEATVRLRALFDKHDGLVRPAIRELVQQIGAEGCGRHDAVLAIAGRLVLQRWSDEQATEFLTPLVNDAFGEGDWSGEVQAALEHARRRDARRAEQIRGVSWKQ